MSAVRLSVSEAFWAMCAADSLSMPVHWYYNIQDISRDFGGWISGFNAPADRHPSSILALSNTAGSGRTAWSTGAKRADVVGSVILHDKLDLWQSLNGSVHYHQGLQAGDNTLNILCSLRAARTIVSRRFADVSQPEVRAAVLSDYVRFLTMPGSHADTYAESFHRSFFADWQDGRPTSPSEVLKFAEKRSKQMLSSRFPDSQLDAIGCLPMILPFILLSASANEDEAVSAAVEFVKLTHPHPKVPEYVTIYSRALHAVLGGASVRQQAEFALKRLEAWDACQSYSCKAARFPASSEERLQVHQNAVSHLGLACYNRGALSSLFYLAYEFHDDPKTGILTNTNCGGENCNRGSALGALLGAGAAHRGAAIPQEWKDELRDAQEFLPDILKFKTSMASISRQTKSVFFFLLLITAALPACTGTPGGRMFVSRREATGFLQRTRRANTFLEELRNGNLERECYEEKCSYEEAREIIPQPQQLENFWRTYTAPNLCLSSPCKNGATCTRHLASFTCKCAAGFYGSKCDKVRSTSTRCRYRNGGCEHFCRENPDRSRFCFCAPGYGLDQDNSTCLPKDPVVCGRPQVNFAPRVVRGQACPKGYCPWQVALYEHNRFSCGAIILSDVWILTAAHCVWRKPSAILHIYVGKHDLETEEKTQQHRRVLNITIHPDYDPVTTDSDLALLKLHRPVKLGLHVIPICLPARNSTFAWTLYNVRQATVSGWGRLVEAGPIARYLQWLVLPRVPLQECRLHTQLNITKNMFCVGHRRGGQDACEGDSGGPLVVKYKKTWFLTGVVSWGKGCAKENMYGVYAKVTNFLDWIETLMATG